MMGFVASTVIDPEKRRQQGLSAYMTRESLLRLPCANLGAMSQRLLGHSVQASVQAAAAWRCMTHAGHAAHALLQAVIPPQVWQLVRWQADGYLHAQYLLCCS